MTKAIVVYESKYGNTKHVAETIVQGMEEAQGVETILSEVKNLDFDNILDYEVILIGSPNHVGGPTKNIKRFIDKLGKLKLKEKRIAVFDTYLGKGFEDAVKKMEKRISKKIPQSKLMISGLSIKVQGMKGPIAGEEPPRCKDFGRKIVTQITTP